MCSTNILDRRRGRIGEVGGEAGGGGGGGEGEEGRWKGKRSSITGKHTLYLYFIVTYNQFINIFYYIFAFYVSFINNILIVYLLQYSYNFNSI